MNNSNNFICTIGRETDDLNNENVFVYKDIRYKKLMIWQDFDRLISKLLKTIF